MAQPVLLFGGASIGAEFRTATDVRRALETAQRCGIGRIDTAARYPPPAPGQSEKLLGDVDVKRSGMVVDTKIMAAPPGAGSLAPAKIEESLLNSLASLRLDKVNVLYCHMPDYQTPLEEQAAAFQEQFEKGRMAYLGVSNFTLEMLEQWMDICDKRGYIKPTYYQGQYNLFCRGSEEKLFPFLHKYKINFVGYSPLAGGFLTGKLTSGEDLTASRFLAGNALGAHFKMWYDKPSMHDAMMKMRVLAQEADLTSSEMALRWVVHHSALKADDGVILGASKTAQIESAVREVRRGPLPPELVGQLEALWDLVKADAPSVGV
ncbi:MAG: hypothetical protein M1838_002539 [Thelocarpon superellum]|nr:MAG: hypothetical protein M1838_002539 [Thelocarpon superellum]